MLLLALFLHSKACNTKRDKYRRESILHLSYIKVLITEVYNYGSDFQMQHGHCIQRRSSKIILKVSNCNNFTVYCNLIQN